MTPFQITGRLLIREVWHVRTTLPLLLGLNAFVMSLHRKVIDLVAWGEKKGIFKKKRGKSWGRPEKDLSGDADNS